MFLDSRSLPFLLAGIELKEGWFDHVNQLKGEHIKFTVLENDMKVIKGILHHQKTKV